MPKILDKKEVDKQKILNLKSQYKSRYLIRNLILC